MRCGMLKNRRASELARAGGRGACRDHLHGLMIYLVRGANPMDYI